MLEGRYCTTQFSYTPCPYVSGTLSITILFDQTLSPLIGKIAAIPRFKDSNVTGTFLFYSSVFFRLDFFSVLLFLAARGFGDWCCRCDEGLDDRLLTDPVPGSRIPGALGELCGHRYIISYWYLYHMNMSALGLAPYRARDELRKVCMPRPTRVQ